MATILVWILVLRLHGSTIVVDNISSQPNFTLLASKIIAAQGNNKQDAVATCHQIRKIIVK